jgi:outer membrane protein assembly factor BamD (BamD/ComL family)
VELRRLLERHPGSQYVAAARSRLAILKARQAEEHEAGESSQ